MQNTIETINNQELTESEQVIGRIAELYQTNPVFFAEHCLGTWTWSKMREIMLSVYTNDRTVVHANHGSSKTKVAADIACWFFNAYPDSKVITTAPTGRQVKDLLWAEIGKNYRTSRFALEGECHTQEVRTDRQEHYIEGFSTDNQSNAEGFHAPQILFILDEAKGIPQWLWDAVDGSLTGGFARVLVLSTTDGVNPGEMFHRILTEPKYKKQWNAIHISAFDSPAITNEKFRTIDIPDLSRPDIFNFKYASHEDLQFQIANPAWIKDYEHREGKDGVLYITKVLGEICDKGLNTIVPLSDVLKMFDNYKLKDFDSTGEYEIGVDVARLGEDSTVMYKRKGLKVVGRQAYNKQRNTYIADRVMELAYTMVKDTEGNEHNISKEIRIKIDDSGVGGGVTDILLKEGYNIIPINFGGTALNENKYPNIISEMWYEVAPIIPQIACPEYERLKTELINRKIPSGKLSGLDNKGRRCIESKDDYKKRGFKSPDDADAFLLCFYTGRRELRIR